MMLWFAPDVQRIYENLHEENGFAEKSKINFIWIQIRKIILFNCQNNYVEHSN